MASIFSSCINWVSFHFHLVLVLLFSANAAFCGSPVKYLPGFQGQLPFNLETGYVTVNESELFYYFIESEGNPKEDPLLLWYSGGPGCSAFNGLIYEIGPLEFNIEDYEGGLPSLKYYPYSWTKGYILGCPLTDTTLTSNSKTIFAHRMGLISDELYESAKNSCSKDFTDIATNNTQCYEDIMSMRKLYKDINANHILEPKCTWASSEPNGELDRRSLSENSGDFILSPPNIPEFWCRGTIRDWKRCNKSLDFTRDVSSVVDYHRNFSKLGLQALVYNGDHDLVVPNVGTEAWIRLLDLTVVNEWRPWLVDGEIAGYTVKYSENGYRLTYATVKGAGHTPQEAKRRECYEMFRRWIHYYPL